MIAFVSTGRKILLCDTTTGTYSEIASGTMGGSAKLALSPDGQWLAVAREDSEVNEGVIDLWSISTGQIVQKLYHPWQISALHFTAQRLASQTANDAGASSAQTVSKTQLVVALTDGTIQVWE
jgi:WD40 repeat protein